MSVSRMWCAAANTSPDLEVCLCRTCILQYLLGTGDVGEELQSLKCHNGVTKHATLQAQLSAHLFTGVQHNYLWLLDELLHLTIFIDDEHTILGGVVNLHPAQSTRRSLFSNVSPPLCLLMMILAQVGAYALTQTGLQWSMPMSAHLCLSQSLPNDCCGGNIAVVTRA